MAVSSTEFEAAPACKSRHEWRLIEETLAHRDIGEPLSRGHHRRLVGRTRRFYCTRCRVTVVDRDTIA